MKCKISYIISASWLFAGALSTATAYSMADLQPVKGEAVVTPIGELSSVILQGEAAEALFKVLSARGQERIGNYDVANGESITCTRDTSLPSPAYQCGFILDETGKAYPDSVMSPAPIIGVAN